MTAAAGESSGVAGTGDGGMCRRQATFKNMTNLIGKPPTMGCGPKGTPLETESDESLRSNMDTHTCTQAKQRILEDKMIKLTHEATLRKEFSRALWCSMSSSGGTL